MKLITNPLLEQIIREAQASPRQRKNYNFHPSDESRCNRLLNALEPGTYIRPHRHLDPEKEELMVLLRGSMGLIFFDDAGQVTATARLTVGSDVFGIDIAAGQYHSLVCLESGTVFLEAKAGPYRLFLGEELAPWAPAEQDAEAAGYRARLERLFTP
ncbi:WbuC family cupin fold metalloprotein [uncultured Thiodictyon sp.]|uniref:WbuC family cupin fold metalloprotein n=1 Tax=uncultured Thiodictyon sp. TaxID=1846217 RepID=UPI0025EF6188|nr:WbuC family cupin fold metalloprotein [uncultured Thiodictyon sp.]